MAYRPIANPTTKPYVSKPSEHDISGDIKVVFFSRTSITNDAGILVTFQHEAHHAQTKALITL